MFLAFISGSMRRRCVLRPEVVKPFACFFGVADETERCTRQGIELCSITG